MLGRVVLPIVLAVTAASDVSSNGVANERNSSGNKSQHHVLTEVPARTRAVGSTRRAALHAEAQQAGSRLLQPLPFRGASLNTASLLGKFNSSNAGWWHDGTFGHVNPALGNLERALAGKWLLIVGDSSVRMAYHLIMGSISRGWEIWPEDVNNHGPGEFSAPPGGCNKTRNASCLEHFSRRGVLLSFLWVDYGREEQLSPLVKFGQGTPLSQPDGIFVGFGAWHKRFPLDPAEPTAPFNEAYKRVLRTIGECFPDSPKLAASLPHCTPEYTCDNAPPRDDEFDAVIRAAAAEHHWQYFERGPVAACPCRPCPISVDSDCSYGIYHPTGIKLNLLVKLMLLKLGLLQP